MAEAQFTRAVARAFSALDEMDQAQLMGLIHYLESDPSPNGRYKFQFNSRDDCDVFLLFDDGRWRIMYHVSPEAGLRIYSFRRYAS